MLGAGSVDDSSRAGALPRPRLGRAGPRRPSSLPIACWPMRSARCSRTGCRRTRSARCFAARAAGSARRRSIGPAMTTAAAGACPRGPGGCCRGAADGASPRATTHNSAARWAISGRSRSVPQPWGPPRGRPLGRRPDHRQEQQVSRGHPHREAQPPDPARRAARRL